MMVSLTGLAGRGEADGAGDAGAAGPRWPQAVPAKTKTAAIRDARTSLVTGPPGTAPRP
jgi:hypothetical protein